MEWYDDRAFHDEVKANTSRVLTATSGNVQNFSLGSKHLDRGDPYSFDTTHQSSWNRPRVHIQSHDQRAVRRQKTNARRLKRRIRLAQKYLQHPRFIDFKARPRKDVDKKTGEVIWDSETETAFQNAMGRRKKSQHGKTFGRNELIMEWIKQETNKVRDRKQVSSHMQTLDNLFKAKPEEDYAGVPEWRMLNRATDDVIDESEGPEFYDNSVADMVRNWRMLQADFSQLDCDFENSMPPRNTQTDLDLLETNSLNRLDFEMWVSSPDKTDEAIHKYTSIQSNTCTAVPEPLENIQGWRAHWPDLVPLVAQADSFEKFDIVLLNVHFQLMLDFPPPRSKLGISLELDFNPIGNEFIADEVKSWSCVTNIYQRGKLDVRVEHNRCPSPGKGRIKPPFESRWWAEQFTRLTEKRRHAMDQDNEAAIAAADEAARNYLNNLKIMQQIFRGPETQKLYELSGTKYGTKYKRTAILLWSFSQTTSKFIGTTTWRKLIPPPARMTINSPLPPSDELALPALSMDTNIENSFEHDGFGAEDAFGSQIYDPESDLYRSKLDDQLCQDGFMFANQNTFMAANPTTTAYLGYQVTGQDSDYHNRDAYHFNAHAADGDIDNQYGLHFDDNLQHNLSTNLFESRQQPAFPQPLSIVPSQPEIVPVKDNGYQSELSFKRDALSSFDSNTHLALQAKLLGNLNTVGTGNQGRSHSAPMKRLPHQTSAASQAGSKHRTSIINNNIHDDLEHGLMANAFSNIDDKSKGCEIVSSIEPYPFSAFVSATEDLNSPIIAPVAVRPILQQHHSFAGITETNPVSIRDPTYDIVRNNYSHLLENLDAVHDDFHNINSIFDLPETSLRNTIPRSYSQPPPVMSLLKEPVIDPDSALDSSTTHHNISTTAVKEIPGIQDGENDWVDVKDEGVAID